MCYSEESSINNYGLGILLSIGLYTLGNNYDKHFALFIFVVVHIQLVEYFMWKDQKCGMMNKIATITSNIILLLQPVSVLFGGYLFNTLNVSNSLLLGISIPYLLIGLLVIIYRFYNDKKQICSRAPDGYLIWFWMKEYVFEKSIFREIFYTLYFLCMFIPWLYLKNFNIGLVIFLLTLGSLLIHSYYHNRENEWQTKWCYYVTSIMLIYISYRIGINYIYTLKMPKM